MKAPRAKRVKAGRALSPAGAKAPITASQELRLGAAITLLFCQGWRVSEVLGLAWEDLDLEAGTAQIRRGASYTPSVGTVLGSTKTSGAEGVHHLAPVSVAHLCVRRDEQKLERATAKAAWPEHVYDGESLSMVFTSTLGEFANRRAVAKEIARAAKIAGLDSKGLASPAADEPSSPRSTPTADLISPMSRVMSATPIRRQQPSTSAASAAARPTPPLGQLNCSTRRFEIDVAAIGVLKRRTISAEVLAGSPSSDDITERAPNRR